MNTVSKTNTVEAPQVSQDPDPEVPEKARRRKYSAAYKARILREADACIAP